MTEHGIQTLLALTVLCLTIGGIALAMASASAQHGFGVPPIIASCPVTEWEHGFETPLVRATRYTSPHFGFNVGFTLPEHPYDCDRGDMMDWLRSKGVHVFQCGGGPGAEILAKVDTVADKEAANIWLPTFLPEFHQWIEANLSR